MGAAHIAPPGHRGAATVAGLRPFAADVLWMNALRAGALSTEYGASAKAVSRRLEISLRLAPDKDERIWEGVLILSRIGDVDAIRGFIAAAKEIRPDQSWIVLEEAWLKWKVESDTSGAFVVLEDAWNRGALPAPGMRLAIGLARAAGDVDREAKYRDRYRRR